MKLLVAVAYHGLSLIALLAHLGLAVIVVLIVAVTVPGGMELPGIVLKVAVAGVWLGLLAVGLLLWKRRRWLAIAMPIVAYACIWILGSIGRDSVGWYLNWGY